MRIKGNIQEEQIVKPLETFLTQQNIADTRVFLQNKDTETTVTIKASLASDEDANILSQKTENFLIDQKIITSKDDVLQLAITGPSVGSYMQDTAITAVVVGLLLMVVYMLFAFSAIRKFISPGALGAVVVATMLFDITVPMWAYGLLMMFNPTISIDSIFIIAILTTMGYSINDTIIIFDRIRENFQAKGWDKPSTNLLYGQVIEDSLWQTMRRSIGTSLSTFLVLIAMFILGTGAIKDFAFTMGIGIAAGSYSSIFIAAPLAYLMLGKYGKEKNKL